MKIENLQKLFVDELKDVYDAEHQILEALPKMSKAASSPQLREAFDSHRRETQGQVRRLEEVFRAFGEEPERKTCDGMKGLLEEGGEFVEAEGDEDAIDAALIGAAQKVEHYEIATYGTLRTFALTLGKRDAAQLLQETLDEESAADEKLTDIAVGSVNPEATEGNGHTGRRGLSGMLESFGIRSRRPAGAGGGRTVSGSRKASGAKKSGKKTGARKSGAKKSGAKKSAAKRTGARKSASKSGAKRSAAKKSGARKSAAKRSSGARKSSRTTRSR